MLIVMFNVLIAIVSDRYNVVMETAEVEVRRLRATTIMDAQALMSKAAKRNAAHFPHYLEVLQPTVATAPSHLSELRAELRAEVGCVESKVESVESKVDAVAGDMAKIMQLLRSK